MNHTPGVIRYISLREKLLVRISPLFQVKCSFHSLGSRDDERPDDSTTESAAESTE